MPTSRALPRSAARIAWAIFGVLAGAFLALILSASPASAADDDSSSSGGLLGTLGKAATTVVSPVVQTVTPVVKAAAPVVETVTDTAGAVVTPVAQTAGAAVGAVLDTTSDAAASVPVVGPAAGAVVSDAGSGVATVVTGATSTVTGLLQDAPLATVTAPILDLVGAVPVVGDVVEDSGSRDLVETVVGVVDDTASDAGDVLDHVVPPVADALDPEDSGSGDADSPATPGSDSTTGPTTAGADDEEPPLLPGAADITVQNAAIATGGALNVAAYSATADLATRTSPANSAGATGIPGSSPPAHAPPAPGASSSAHAGGSSFHDGARLHAASSGALAFAERTPHPSGDALPDAPVTDTDVSPD